MEANPQLNQLFLHLLETFQHEGVVTQSHVTVSRRDTDGHMQRYTSLQGFCLAV